MVTLTYLRRNRVQAELAETFDVSQSTISRAVTGLTPVLGAVLAGYVPTAEDLDETAQYVVDGTLLPVLVMGVPRPGTVLRQTRRRPVRALGSATTGTPDRCGSRQNWNVGCCDR